MRCFTVNNNLGRSITFFSLFKFTAPTIVMLIFISMYTMVDGAFVSNLIGPDALSAINIVYPIQSTIIAISIMLATGSSAIIARKMGEGLYEEARSDFSLIVIFGIFLSLVVTILSLIFIDDIVEILGATPSLHHYSKSYLWMLTLFFPMGILQMLFQFLFVTAGKPHLGLISTIAAGVTNIVLDYTFIAIFDMGISGAALATGIGFCIPALTGLLYFTYCKKSFLYFVKPKMDLSFLLNSCSNGMSEMVTNMATSVTTFLFNITMIKLAGEDGAAAIAIILYAQFTLTAIYMGYSDGVAPIVSFNYGKKDIDNLKKIFKISISFICISSVIIYVLSIIFESPLIEIFVKKGSNPYLIALGGFPLFALSYIFAGINIYASALFTALGNGKVSAVISMARTFLFLVSGILILPSYIGIKGVWLSVPLAELLTLFMSAAFIYKYRKFYGYA